jgi:hypothetical protein
MKIFLIDFENVRCEGLNGIDALTEDDEVVVFYSDKANTITFDTMHKLTFCKAKLSYYKIRRGGQNALDFQMASYLGYLISTNIDTDGVEFYLISRDSGFDFVIDFWESGNINIKPKVKRFYSVRAVFAKPKLRAPVQKPPIALKPLDMIAETNKTTEIEPLETPEIVEVTLVKSDEPVEIVEVESAKITEVIEIVEVAEPAEEESAEYAETHESAEVPEVPAHEADAETIEAVARLLSESKSSHELYIGTVKRFGQKKGVEIYRNIKSQFFTKKASSTA